MGKNVVILKGGKNAQGSQAAASHTGALKQDYEVFYHLCMQCGATMVGSLHDFIVGLKSFQYGRKTKNRNLLMIGPSGGATVLAADQCGVFGINLTEIPEDERNVLMSLGVPPGSTLRNPVDLPVGALAHENGMLVKHVCEAAYKNNTYEFTLIHLNIQNIQSYTLDPELILSNICRTAIEVANTHRKETQVFVSLRMNSESRVDEMCRTYAKFLQSHGIATFWAIDDALSAIRFLTCGNSAM